MRVIDVLWMDHLDAMVRMREGIGLIGYAQKDPLSEYKQEAYTMFHRLLAAIAADVTRMIFKVRVTPSIPRSSAEMEAKRKMAMRGAEEPTGDFKDETKEVAAGQQVSRPAYQTGRSAGQQKSNLGKRSGDKIGRNDPCPCGSGLKYKKCHGK